MLIWGTRRTVQRLAIIMLSCPQGHPAAHTVLRLVTKFTLFFIPLFPIRTRHMVQCTLCGMSGEVDRAHADELVTSAAAADDANRAARSTGVPPGGLPDQAPGSRAAG